MVVFCQFHLVKEKARFSFIKNRALVPQPLAPTDAQTSERIRGLVHPPPHHKVKVADVGHPTAHACGCNWLTSFYPISNLEGTGVGGYVTNLVKFSWDFRGDLHIVKKGPKVGCRPPHSVVLHQMDNCPVRWGVHRQGVHPWVGYYDVDSMLGRTDMRWRIPPKPGGFLPSGLYWAKILLPRPTQKVV